mmetsp:Transcript_6935/g.19310  ORF Transcript_6935/g.19310 Transcript_6935/m.19310 type:complete len:232 (-) Transcript_6935:389-1084(-)
MQRTEVGVAPVQETPLPVLADPHAVPGDAVLSLAARHDLDDQRRPRQRRPGRRRRRRRLHRVGARSQPLCGGGSLAALRLGRGGRGPGGGRQLPVHELLGRHGGPGARRAAAAGRPAVVAAAARPRRRAKRRAPAGGLPQRGEGVGERRRARERPVLANRQRPRRRLARLRRGPQPVPSAAPPVGLQRALQLPAQAQVAEHRLHGLYGVQALGHAPVVGAVRAEPLCAAAA